MWVAFVVSGELHCTVRTGKGGFSAALRSTHTILPKGMDGRGPGEKRDAPEVLSASHYCSASIGYMYVMLHDQSRMQRLFTVQ
jgi:hypothetical protein